MRPYLPIQGLRRTMGKTGLHLTLRRFTQPMLGSVEVQIGTHREIGQSVTINFWSMM